MVLALGLGLALGGGLAVGLDLLSSSFKDALEIEEYLGLTVTCSVPFLPLPREEKVNRLKLIGFWVYLFLGLVCIGGALLYMWKTNILVL